MQSASAARPSACPAENGSVSKQVSKNVPVHNYPETENKETNYLFLNKITFDLILAVFNYI